MKNNKLSVWLFTLAIPLLILLTPTSAFPIEGLTVIQHRVIAIFMLAAIMWILEPVPIYATSILIIFLELVMISDKGFNLLIAAQGEPGFGNLLSYQSIFSTFASPIILLFLGGFFLAIASSKYRLDQNLARVLLKPFGTKPSMIIMGMMGITAIFSMFMSNTATTAMMLSIISPIIIYFDKDDPGKVAMVLCIPLAANIGGIGTPIGTPPNAIALKYLTAENAISFGQWVAFALPFALFLLIIGWLILNSLFPARIKEINIDIKGKFLKTKKAIIVYITFVVTIFMWLFDFLHGMNAYIVAMIPVATFLMFNIITKEDLKKISWDILWLVSGGIALGLALAESGLAENAVKSIPFTELSALLIIGLAALLATIMANFMSNTASANLLLPIIAAIGATVASIEPYGGAKTLILGTTLAASFGMALPISTPPNALAHSTGAIETKQMALIGVIMAVIGLMAIFGLLYLLRLVGFL